MSTEPFNVKIKKLTPEARIPVRASKDAAAFDLYATTRVEIYPGEVAVVPLGFSTEFPKGYVGLIYSRSGMTRHLHIRLANNVGVIDADYRGEWQVMLWADIPFPRLDGRTYARMPYTRIEPGDRVAQVIFQKVEDAVFLEVDELSDTERGEGGFGSTGMTDVIPGGETQ